MRLTKSLQMGLMGICALLVLGGAFLIPTVDAQPVLPETPNLTDMNIYFSEANGEASRFDRSDNGISRFAGLLSRMGANLFTLEWRKNIPANADLIILTGPEADYTTDQAARLWAYLMSGGRLLLLTEPFDSRGGENRALAQERSFFDLTWSDLGLRNRSDVLAEPGELITVQVTERDDQGNDVTTDVETPMLNFEMTASDINAAHPILSTFSPDAVSLYFNTVRTVEIDASIQSFDVRPLLFSPSAGFYGESDLRTYTRTGVSEITDADLPFGSYIVAASMEDTISDARMVLIGDADFARNGGGLLTSPAYSGAFVYPDNAQFMMNAVAWLVGAEPVTFEFETPAPLPTPTLMPTPTPEPTPETAEDTDGDS